MKNIAKFLGLLCACIMLLGHNAAFGQTGGLIIGWGSSVVVEPSGLEDLVKIAAGSAHSLGLKSDGSIVAWGTNNYGQCNVPEPNTDFVAVAGGGYHSLGLKSDGSIVAWGSNSFGQCNVPEPNSDFVAVAGGRDHNLGLKSDGSIVAWGRNNYGQCNVPEPNADFVAVAGGVYHSLGLKSDGSIVAWGYNNSGQCNVLEPNADFVAVAGGYHSLGLKSDGSIVAWGRSNEGQCNVPEPNADFVAVAGGAYHSLGLKSDGSIVAWGSNSLGQYNVPEPNADFVAVAGGDSYSLGLKSDGSIVAWGYMGYGQNNVPEPNTDFVAVAGKGYHSLGLKSDGSIVAWGYNDYGQCNVPEPNADFVAVAGGVYHSLGLKSDGSIVAWGPTNSSSCNVPEPNADFVAVAGGDSYSLGLKSDGSIVAWGRSNEGQCNVPEPNADFVAVAGGAFHSLGLKSDGSIVAWGNNGYGQCNVPVPNGDFVAVAGGRDQSLGLKSTSSATNLTITPANASPIPCSGNTSLSFNFVPTFESPAVKGYSVRVVASSQVSFSTSDFQVNTVPQGEQVYFQVIENASNDFTLDYVILGTGTAGITTPEALFSVTFHGVDDGPAVVSILAAELRDLNNTSIPVKYFSWAAISVDCTPPVAVPTAIATPGHEQTTLTWTDPTDLGLSCVQVFRGLWHDGKLESVYPGFGQVDGNTVPTQFPTYAEYSDSPEWEMTGTIDVGIGSLVDPVTTRGIYFYQLFAVDTAGNVSDPLVSSPVATNYLLGDVVTPYDGEVDIADLTMLGDSYGVACGHQYFNAEVDVGPTDNGSGNGLPVPDCLVGFEDLMIFGFNYGGVAMAKSSPPGGSELNISWVQQSELEWSCILTQPCPNLKGIHLVDDGWGMQGAQVERGTLLSEQSGQVFLQKANSPIFDIGMVVLGAGHCIEGVGELFRVTFVAPLASFNPRMEARDTENHAIEIQLMENVVVPIPKHYSLQKNYPNPFNPSTTIQYGLPNVQDVNLSIYSVDGRLVRTLVAELQPAGVYYVVWDGRNDRNRAAASGIYFSRLEAGEFSAMEKMVLMK